MIAFLARIFRSWHWVVGATAPQSGENERAFVFVWLGIVAFAIAFCAGLWYAILHVF